MSPGIRWGVPSSGRPDGSPFEAAPPLTAPVSADAPLRVGFASVPSDSFQVISPRSVCSAGFGSNFTSRTTIASSRDTGIWSITVIDARRGP